MASLGLLLETLRDWQDSLQSLVETQKTNVAFYTKKLKVRFLWMFHKFSFIAEMSPIFLEGPYRSWCTLRIIDNSYSLFILPPFHEKQRDRQRQREAKKDNHYIRVLGASGSPLRPPGIFSRLYMDKGLEVNTRNHPWLPRGS